MSSILSSSTCNWQQPSAKTRIGREDGKQKRQIESSVLDLDKNYHKWDHLHLYWLATQMDLDERRCLGGLPIIKVLAWLAELFIVYYDFVACASSQVLSLTKMLKFVIIISQEFSWRSNIIPNYFLCDLIHRLFCWPFWLAWVLPQLLLRVQQLWPGLLLLLKLLPALLMLLMSPP